MVQKERLIRFYLEQYELRSKKKRKAPPKAAGLADRLERLRMALRRAKGNRSSIQVIEDYHRQTYNMSWLIFRQNRTKMIEVLKEDIIPNLVRLDMEMILPEERDGVSEDFLDYMAEQ